MSERRVRKREGRQEREEEERVKGDCERGESVHV